MDLRLKPQALFLGRFAAGDSCAASRLTIFARPTGTWGRGPRLYSFAASRLETVLPSCNYGLKLHEFATTSSRSDRVVLRSRRGPAHCVEDEGVNVLAAFVEAEECLFEVASAVASEEAEDVFEEDERGLARFEAVEEVDEAPEGG